MDQGWTKQGLIYLLVACKLSCTITGIILLRYQLFYVSL